MRTIPAMLDFLSPLSLVPGMGPKRSAAMQEANVGTIGDLLYRFPLRYLDRSIITTVKDTGESIETTCTVLGTIESVSIERGKRARLRALLTDGTGTLELLWFQGVAFYRQSIKKGHRIIATGKITRFNRLQMVHPTIETLSKDAVTSETPILPLYGLTGAMRDAGIGQRFRLKTIQWIFNNLKHYPASLPAHLEKKHPFPPIAACLKELHFPTDCSKLDTYRDRIRYEELYKLALTLHFSRRKFMLPGRSLLPGDLKKLFLQTLPFKLTIDQSDAVRVLLDDIAAPRRMHRLLQGDVGCGKTVVAFLAALPALNTGLQVVWMTPTEILADQTCCKINEWLLPLGFEAATFTSASRTSGTYNDLRRKISSGELKFIIGTHALLQPTVTFNRVGIFIIDEQHRFGAAQRLTLHDKDSAADFLLMSATPIPQTLARTLYGDLDIVSIQSLPPGRRPVATHLVGDEKRNDMEAFIAKQLAAGAQCYYIVPRIEKEESVDEEKTSALVDLETAFCKISAGRLGQFRPAYMHGRLSAAEKGRILNGFYQKEISLLVATSVVEVGLDVPAATVIVIENSERFGLAQLHQLRGRVGRSTDESYCFLMNSSQFDEETKNRLQSFCKEHDGFAVAELDLKNRGPGEVNGFRQSGWEDLIMSDILRDATLFAEIRNEVTQQF
jgi:ATP-dependent DNA helicase RecG